MYTSRICGVKAGRASHATSFPGSLASGDGKKQDCGNEVASAQKYFLGPLFKKLGNHSSFLSGTWAPIGLKNGGN